MAGYFAEIRLIEAFQRLLRSVSGFEVFLGTLEHYDRWLRSGRLSCEAEGVSKWEKWSEHGPKAPMCTDFP